MGRIIKAQKVSRTPPRTLGEWKKAHGEHGRTFHDVDIGVYRIHRCGGCGESGHTEKRDAGMGDDAPLTSRAA
jgi:hypothetical protein